MSNWWGLRPEENDNEYRPLWGARAIDDPGTFSLLSDRQSWQGGRGQLDGLSTLLNRGEALARAKEKWRELKRDGEVSRDKARRVVLYKDPLIRIEADTRASYGYVYLCAYYKREVDFSTTRFGGTATSEVTELDGLPPIWSSRGPVPEVGQVVPITCWMTDDEDPTMTVTGHTTEWGFLFTWGVLNCSLNQRGRDQLAASELGPIWNVCGADMDRHTNRTCTGEA